MANKCGICGADINLMQTQKLADGNCICRKNCRSRGFKVYDYVHGNLPGVKAHLAQVERGTKLWEHYFVPRLKTKDKTQKLTRFGARRAEAHTVNHIVKTAFEEGKQRFAGVALTAGGFGVVTAELTFENAVGALHLLLFTQLDRVVAQFFKGAAMLPGRVAAAVKGALVGEATLTSESKERRALFRLRSEPSRRESFNLGPRYRAIFYVTSSILRR